MASLRLTHPDGLPGVMGDLPSFKAGMSIEQKQNIIDLIFRKGNISKWTTQDLTDWKSTVQDTNAMKPSNFVGGQLTPGGYQEPIQEPIPAAVEEYQEPITTQPISEPTTIKKPLPVAVEKYNGGNQELITEPATTNTDKPTSTNSGGDNVMEPIDQLLSHLTERIETEQPTEAEMLDAAHERYDPYYQEESDLMREYYGTQMAGKRRSGDVQIANARRNYQSTMAYIGQSRQALQQEYKLYMEDIETGKLRAGSDEQKTKERALENKAMTLAQMEADQTIKMQNMQRSYISRGGLYSGKRRQATRLGEEDYGRGIEGVEMHTQRTVDDASEQYQRAMEDYLAGGKKAAASLSSGQGRLSAQASSARGGFEGTQASVQAGITSAQEAANYQMKTRQRQLDFDKEKALMDYVYGERTYDYLDL